MDADDLLAAGMTPDLALWVADLMAAEERYRLASCREAFERGRVAGREEGRCEAEAEEARAWRVLLGRYRDTMRQPPFAQIEHKRYGPAGRQSWMIRRPGETVGRDPGEIRRRASRAGVEDPLDPAVMLARVRASWAELYPAEFPVTEEDEDAQA